MVKWFSGHQTRNRKVFTFSLFEVTRQELCTLLKFKYHTDTENRLSNLDKGRVPIPQRAFSDYVNFF